MNNRIVVPVYDDDYNLVVGYVGKSIYPQCPKCKLYHSTKVACPVYRYQKMLCSKWKNSPNFAAEDYLYNYWFAKDYIKNSGIAILVEGQSDVWRMVEANFHNVVGLFGTSLTTHQQLILEQSGAIKLVLCLDGDTAGKRAAELIKKQCGHIFTIDVINLSHNIDPGQLFCFQLRQILYDYILEKQTN